MGHEDPLAHPSSQSPCYHENMTSMELYVKFMFTLAIGLVGLSLVLFTLLETVLAYWDPVVDARHWWRRVTQHRSGVASIRAEDILSEIEGRQRGLTVRLTESPIDQRREVLRDVREAESRLASPAPFEPL